MRRSRTSTRWNESEAGHRCFHLFFRLLVLFSGTFVVQFAALPKADGELDPGTLEVNVQRDQGKAFLIELTALQGRQALDADVPCQTLFSYS